MSTITPYRDDLGIPRFTKKIRRWLGKTEVRKLVTLHHLACSGGTIMTKCLAAMDTAMVLSEIHPTRRVGGLYHPMSQIARGYKDQLGREHRQAIRAHFRREILVAHEIARSLGRVLVVRDHSHVDFVWDRIDHSILVEELEPMFRIQPIVTIRDPRQVFVSTQREGWFDGSPDELCQMTLNLLDAFPDAPVFHYEHFTRDPKTVVRQMCEVAGIVFQPDFEQRLDQVVHMTGDSGRKGDVIEPRPPKPLTPEIARAFDESPAFAALVQRYPEMGAS